jgi:hypothetical protein
MVSRHLRTSSTYCCGPTVHRLCVESSENPPESRAQSQTAGFRTGRFRNWMADKNSGTSDRFTHSVMCVPRKNRILHVSLFHSPGGNVPQGGGYCLRSHLIFGPVSRFASSPKRFIIVSVRGLLGTDHDFAAATLATASNPAARKLVPGSLSSV